MNERTHVCMLTHVPKCTLVPPTAGTFTTNKLCKLRELFLPCAWHQGAAQCLRSDRRLRDERARVRGLACHPYSVLVFCWQTLHMTLTLAALLYMPFQVFMDCPNRFDPFILFMDVMAFINILLSFVTGYVTEHNKLIVLQPRLIALHYLTTNFRFDLVGMLPLQVIELFKDCRYPSHTIMLLLKLCRLVTFAKEWKILLQQLHLSYDKRRLASTSLQVVLFFHWMTYFHHQVPCLLVHFLKNDASSAWWVKAFYNKRNLHDTLIKRYPSHTIMLLLKLCRLVTFAKEWKILLQQLHLSYDKRRLASTSLQVVLFFHWMTYFHHQVPCLLVHFLKNDASSAWWVKAFYNKRNLHDTLIKRYIVHLFRTSGICIGAGYASTEDDQYLICDLLLTTFTGISGLLFLTYTLATFLQLAMYKQYDKNLFDGRINQLQEYMSYKRLPKYLQRKIKMFIDYKFNGHYYNENIIMNTINEQLKQDINMYGAKRLVMNVPIFQDMPISLINAIIFRLTQVLYMPGQVLVKYGEPGKSLYLISSGTLAVMNAAGREMAHLRDGAYLGMTALLYPGTERSATIIALEITEIYSLDHNSLQTCLQPYPHLKRRIEDTFLKLRMRN